MIIDPMVSIITINLNNAEGLKRTLQSINAIRSLNSIEHIIIDGASTDESIAVARSQMLQDHDYTFISEKDSGIYNAMNKGASLASGTFLAFINSGDEIIPEKYNDYLKFVEENISDADISYAQTLLRDEKSINEAPHKRSHQELHKDTIPHLTTLTRKTLFNELGGFDEKYKICSDRDFFIRAKNNNARFQYYANPICIFETGGISSSRRKARLENMEINISHKLISKLKYKIKLLINKFQSLRD